MEPFIHICEVCDKKEITTSETAFQSGWDYPPRFGDFGVISPRTCGDCGIEETLWWELAVNRGDPKSLPARHLKTLERILSETSI